MCVLMFGLLLASNMEWMKTMPAPSMQHPLSAMSMSNSNSNDSDDRSHVQPQPLSQQQPVFLPMVSHGAGPMMGAPPLIQHLGFQTGPPPAPGGPPSMSLPRGMIAGLQHSGHMSGMTSDAAMEQQVSRQSWGNLSRLNLLTVLRLIRN
jgi:hypothetical protein